MYSEGSFPIVGFAAGCRAAPPGEGSATWERHAARLERHGVRVFLLLHRKEAIDPPQGAELVADVPSEGELTWFIYGSS